MRLNEVTGYSLKELLTEIDRRGFLKGLSAAAATAAIPSLAKAGDKKDPFDSVDQVEPPKKQKPVDWIDPKPLKHDDIKLSNSDKTLFITGSHFYKHGDIIIYMFTRSDQTKDFWKRNRDKLMPGMGRVTDEVKAFNIKTGKGIEFEEKPPKQVLWLGDSLKGLVKLSNKIYELSTAEKLILQNIYK